jgi:hypothetical protein
MHNMRSGGKRQLSAATSTEAGWWGPFAKR